jgi:hypothetical protein
MSPQLRARIEDRYRDLNLSEAIRGLIEWALPHAPDIQSPRGDA